MKGHKLKNGTCSENGESRKSNRSKFWCAHEQKKAFGLEVLFSLSRHKLAAVCLGES